MGIARNDSEKKYIERMKKLDDDTYDYIKELLRELYFCYERLGETEESLLLTEFYEGKEKGYERLFYLLHDVKFMDMFNEAKDEFNKKKKKKPKTKDPIPKKVYDNLQK